VTSSNSFDVDKTVPENNSYDEKFASTMFWLVWQQVRPDFLQQAP
jgi:hypothetical protein